MRRRQTIIFSTALSSRPIIYLFIFFFPRYRLPASLHLFLHRRSILPGCAYRARRNSCRAQERARDRFICAIINDYDGARRVPRACSATGADNRIAINAMLLSLAFCKRNKSMEKRPPMRSCGIIFNGRRAFTVASIARY